MTVSEPNNMDYQFDPWHVCEVGHKAICIYFWWCAATGEGNTVILGKNGL